MTPRIGFGYDVHRTAPGEGIRLGGVELPAPFSLQAHSDGDVLLHAIIDALLGALAEWDIGTHFPDDDPDYQNASGAELLQRCLSILEERGYRLGNLDASIIAERPKLKPYVPEMREALAMMTDWPKERISIKATTHEGLGPIGQGEGLAVHAVALLIPSEASADHDA